MTPVRLDLPEFLTQGDLETRWRLSGRTLERWRADRYGPAWITLGGSIRYRLADVERHTRGTEG
ncbi:DNA-binding protein [Silicimonas algicola]|uniref:Helix-turn-helix protein n=1 Tax=Silicimonas algicola TaxID=1826607 RepID=A0A316FSW6_9RHOB|nr:DNA-binding protein [Silicimonas algicola]AZQ67643.1 DNA-binding protein [Silicimonas algicola]PWK51679.1 hypothetical protein C8D95_11722 [Silicimonas algicola]